MTVKWSEIEEKWRKKWIEEKHFETDPNDTEKKFITVAYPYPGFTECEDSMYCFQWHFIIQVLRYLGWQKE